MLDVAPIRIGSAVQIATCVQLPRPRIRLIRSRAASAGVRRADHSRNNVWLGGGAIVLPGVTIGANTVLGAGSVLTRDLPAGVVAFGNPARVHRPIADSDHVSLPEN